MDAAGYLKKHGWRGTGHSLDATNKGLRKPLLVSKKIDVLGIGINKHDVIADQWWMKAFDSSLKDFGTGKKGLLGNVKEHGVRRGGLYARFVQGEGVPGTIGANMLVGDQGCEDMVLKKKKRKLEDGDEDGDLGKRIKKSKNKTSSTETKKRSKRDAKNTDGSDGTSTEKKRKREKKTLDRLSPSKRQQYVDRAAAKGLSIEQYFAQRQLKNLEASNARHQSTTTNTSNATSATASASNSASEDSASSKAEKSRKKKSDREERARGSAPEQSGTETSASKSNRKDQKRKRKDEKAKS